VRARSEQGQATTELALLLPLVVLLLLAVLQVAVIARDDVLVTHAAREAARVVAVDARPAAALAAARSGGLRAERVQVQVTGRRGAGSRAIVRVSYRSPTEVPIVGTLLGDPLMVAVVTIRVE
jgi:hypothetical protein